MQLQTGIWNNKNLIKVLQDGGVVVMPTDTLYGIVGSALNRQTVERIYKIRKRAPEKPCIILVGDISELEKFSVQISPEEKSVISRTSVPTSFVFNCTHEELLYLHRGTQTLAFRIPAQDELRDLLIKTGPLIAPSANTEGLPPSNNITEAKNYFDTQVNIYIDGGEISGKASKVVKLHSNGTADILRK